MLYASPVDETCIALLQLSKVSACNCAVGSGRRADGCASLAMAALINSMLQQLSMVASHSLIVNLSSMGMAGWSKAGPHGATSPTNK